MKWLGSFFFLQDWWALIGRETSSSDLHISDRNLPLELKETRNGQPPSQSQSQPPQPPPPTELWHLQFFHRLLTTAAVSSSSSIPPLPPPRHHPDHPCIHQAHAHKKIERIHSPFINLDGHSRSWTTTVHWNERVMSLYHMLRYYIIKSWMYLYRLFCLFL